MSDSKEYKIGIDIGGTHTDFVVVKDAVEGRSIRTYKVPSTPEYLIEAILDGCRKAAQDDDLSLESFLGKTGMVFHGTTVTTNALLEGTEAKTGLLTTEGFRDVLELNIKGRDEELLDLRKEPSTAVIPGRLRQEIPERTNKDGEVLEPLDMEALDSSVDRLVNEGAEAIATAFMFSFRNDEHEQSVMDYAADREDIRAWSFSSEILPQIGIYDRAVGTIVDASLKPVLRDYLRDLERELRDNRFDGSLLIMQANGGLSTVDIIRQRPITTVNSGPAAGTVASAYQGTVAGFDKIVSVDMGGTSCDAGLCVGGSPLITTNNRVGDTPVPIPMNDINTIGAGGGSIAWIDDQSVLRIGPKSAGADPGPICYDRGGHQPTVTDANLVLGYLNPEYFLGGSRELNVEKARAGIEEQLAEQLGLTIEEVASGIYQLTNERIINQIRQVTVKRGYDPREFSFVAYGGAAPVHAGVIGERFEAPVLVPHAAGAFSAFGLMQSNIKYDLVQSLSQPLAPDTLNAIDNTYQELKSDARELQVEADIPKNHGDFVLTLETRYEGQVEEISQTIASVEELSVEMIEEAHHQQHETLYDFSDESWEIEVINVRLSIVGEIEGVGQVGAAGILPSKALKQERNVYFEQPGKFIETPIYAGEDGLSEPVEGPAIIELSHTTIVVPPGSTATYNNNGYYRIRSSVI